MSQQYDMSQRDDLGNDASYRQKLFAHLALVDGRSYLPVTAETMAAFPGKYRRRYLNVGDSPLGAWEEVELTADGAIIPDNRGNKWAYRQGNIFVIYTSFPAMPEYDVEAGVEEEPYYVFLETKEQSLLFSNGDTSLLQIYEKF